MSECKLRLEAVLERCHVQLFEPRDLVLREPLVGQIRQRGPSPQRESRLQTTDRVDVVAVRECGPTFGEQPLEAVAIELIRLESEAVGTADGADRVGRQLLTQGRDAVLQDLGRGRGRLVSPELVDDHVAGQGLVAVQEQEGEDSALSRAAERNSSLVVERLDRAEDAVVHGDRA
jgi:hypothetical protein